jgi:hypothetical protein
MDYSLLLDNLTNPALLFFILGILAVRLKSDLCIPETSSKFISLYLLLSIGFKGGQELAHSEFSFDIIKGILFGITIATVIPFYIFFLLKKKLGIDNAGAIAASYGSVSAVTFVTALSFLEIQQLNASGYMVATMALMEAPAIIVGVMLIRLFGENTTEAPKLRTTIKHSITNGSVLLILGSLLIGLLANDQQAQGIKPFTTDLFKGFLAIFLLDMGIESGKRLKDFLKSGGLLTVFAIAIPLLNGIAVAVLSGSVSDNIANRFMFAVLAASASYIAVPAAMKIAAPKANPGIYFPMALAITFPFNITLGMPIYLLVVKNF